MDLLVKELKNTRPDKYEEKPDPWLEEQLAKVDKDSWMYNELKVHISHEDTQIKYFQSDSTHRELSDWQKSKVNISRLK